MKTLFRQIQLGRFVLLILIALVCVGSLGIWLRSRLYVSTDDANVNAHVVQIASRVTGPVSALSVAENDSVVAGALLLAIDSAQYEAALVNAKAAAEQASAERSIAQITAKRTLSLVKKRAASIQEGDIANARLKFAEAGVTMAKSQVTAAELNLHYTRITSPVTGTVTRMTLRAGSLVTANQPLFAIVSNDEFWIDANFRETDMHFIRQGLPVLIRIDMYPKHLFHGEVESISMGTGAVFSLLPPENATGNWVKVTQRVPVRIRIIDSDPHYPLRIGSSAWVRIKI